MNSTAISFANIHNHGELFANVLRVRRESVTQENRWEIPETVGIQYDQYDTPASRWIAIHEFGEVYAGIRLTPTTMKCGMYSYMIRDAQRGLLGTIPEDLLYEEAPVDEQTWECTRVFVSHTTPQRIRRRVHALMVAAMLKGSREQGASKLITLTASNWPRWFGRCGLDAKAVGREMFIGDGDYQCVMIDLTSNLH